MLLKSCSLDSGAKMTYIRHFRLTVVNLYLIYHLVELLLPSYRRCPLHFIRKLVVGEKKVTANHQDVHRRWNWQMWQSFKVPKYSELKVEDLWAYVERDEELADYFPDYEPNILPERSFIMKILWTLRKGEMRDLIHSGKKKEVDS